MKLKVTVSSKFFLRFIVERHFILLLLILLSFIAYAGWIFWRDAYTVIKTPVVPDAIPSVSGALFEELRNDVLSRSQGTERALLSPYVNPFR